MGIVIGALFEQFINWRWIFWFNGFVALPITTFCAFAVPPSLSWSQHKHETWKQKLRRLDVLGVSGFTAGFLLFIYGLTTAPEKGWESPQVLAPIIISIFMIAGFMYYETVIPEDQACL